MKIARFSGYSNDTFACYSEDFDVDFYTWGSGEPVSMMVSVDGEDRLLVTGQYAPDSGVDEGTWAITVQPVIEDGAFCGLHPVFSIPEDSYSPLLLVEGPDEMDVRLLEACLRPVMAKAEWRCDGCVSNKPCFLTIVGDDSKPTVCPLDGNDELANWQPVEEEKDV